MTKTKRMERIKNTETGVVTFKTEDWSVKCDAHDIFQNYDKENGAAKWLILHAINAKVGDSVSAWPEDPKGKLEAVWNALKAGEVTTRVAGGGSSKTTVLAEAIAEVTKHDLAKVIEKLASMGKEEKAAVKKSPQIAAVITRLNAERAQAKSEAAKKSAKGAEAFTFDV